MHRFFMVVGLCRQLILLGIFISSILSIPSEVFGDTLQLRADMWAPFNGDPLSPRPGYVIEVTREVFQKAGHEINYQVEPWARSVQQVEVGQIDGLVGASPGDAPSLVYPDEHMGIISFAFFTAANNTWSFSGVESLKSHRLGHIVGYSYGDTLNGYLDANKTNQDRIFTLSGEEPLFLGLKMLSKGRLDILVSTPQVLQAEVETRGLDRAAFRFAGEMLEKDKIYIAFSPKNPKSPEYAKILTEGIRSMRTSGRLREILSLYRLEDWR